MEKQGLKQPGRQADLLTASAEFRSDRRYVSTPPYNFMPCKGETLSSTLYATNYRGAVKSLARPTPPCILFDVENILFDASLVIYK
jgi:hypothetical protein